MSLYVETRSLTGDTGPFFYSPLYKLVVTSYADVSSVLKALGEGCLWCYGGSNPSRSLVACYSNTGYRSALKTVGNDLRNVCSTFTHLVHPARCLKMFLRRDDPGVVSPFVGNSLAGVAVNVENGIGFGPMSSSPSPSLRHFLRFDSFLFGLNFGFRLFNFRLIFN